MTGHGDAGAGLPPFADYPMGPKLRAFLGIESPLYTGDEAQDPEEAHRAAFGAHLLGYAQEHPIEDEATLVDLLDELVTMNLPETVVALADTHTALFPEDDFRAELAVGVAAMMTGDL